MEKMAKKNKIIASILLFATLFAMFFACISLCFTPLSVSFAEEVSTATPVANEETDEYSNFSVLDYIDISQEGYVFTKDDFVEYDDQDYQGYKYAIFTNRTVTINKKIDNSINHKFTININNLTTESLLDSAGYIYRSETNEISYVLDVNGKTNDVKNNIKLEFTFYYPASPAHPGGDQKTITLLFFIIQTPTNFEKENSSASNNFIVWDYVYRNQLISTTAPGSGETFETLNLTFPAGTQLNPVYVEFIYCGEHYLIYRYKDPTTGTIKTFNSIGNEEMNLDKLTFNKSGTYTVRIFDKTINTNCPDKNFYEYSFIISNTSSSTAGFYVNAVDETNNPIMSGQYTNSNVIVNFVNYNKIKSQVYQITVIRAYQPSLSENIPITTTYAPDDLPSSITYSDDGTYDIKFENRRGDILFEYKFVITKSIKTSFKIGNSVYEVGENEASNVTKEFTIDSFQSSEYNGIVGNTDFSFTILVARSAPNIVGIANNDRTQDNVSLRVYGVGTIDVYVSLNGAQMMIDTKYENGSRLPTFTEQGNYFVRITDEMGSTITRSFTITMKLNTASIILIVIAAVAIVGLIVFIIISRGRVKVR